MSPIEYALGLAMVYGLYKTLHHPKVRCEFLQKAYTTKQLRQILVQKLGAKPQDLRNLKGKDLCSLIQKKDPHFNSSSAEDFVARMNPRKRASRLAQKAQKKAMGWWGKKPRGQISTIGVVPTHGEPTTTCGTQELTRKQMLQIIRALSYKLPGVRYKDEYRKNLTELCKTVRQLEAAEDRVHSASDYNTKGKMKLGQRLHPEEQRAALAYLDAPSPRQEQKKQGWGDWAKSWLPGSDAQKFQSHDRRKRPQIVPRSAVPILDMPASALKRLQGKTHYDLDPGHLKSMTAHEREDGGHINARGKEALLNIAAHAKANPGLVYDDQEHYDQDLVVRGQCTDVFKEFLSFEEAKELAEIYEVDIGNARTVGGICKAIRAHKGLNMNLHDVGHSLAYSLITENAITKAVKGITEGTIGFVKGVGSGVINLGASGFKGAARHYDKLGGTGKMVLGGTGYMLTSGLTAGLIPAAMLAHEGYKQYKEGVRGYRRHQKGQEFLKRKGRKERYEFVSQDPSTMKLILKQNLGGRITKTRMLRHLKELGDEIKRAKAALGPNPSRAARDKISSMAKYIAFVGQTYAREFTALKFWRKFWSKRNKQRRWSKKRRGSRRASRRARAGRKAKPKRKRKRKRARSLNAGNSYAQFVKMALEQDKWYLG